MNVLQAKRAASTLTYVPSQLSLVESMLGVLHELGQIIHASLGRSMHYTASLEFWDQPVAQFCPVVIIIELYRHAAGKPTIKITLKRGADTSATVNIGDTTIGGKNAFTFVTTADNPDRHSVHRLNL